MRELSDLLRKKADEIDAAASKLSMPITERVNIPEAFGRMRIVFGPDVHISIRPPDFDSYSFAQALTAGKWTVYIGADAGTAHGRHEGINLNEAVNAAIAAWNEAKHPRHADATEAAREVAEELGDPLPL